MSDPEGADAGAGGPSRGRGTADGSATEDANLREYAHSLGVDIQQHEDLLWVVREAFHAPLPFDWSEYTDNEGRIYFFRQTHNESTWEHPMDAVYRELLGLVRDIRAREPGSSEERRAALIHGHLKEVHQRALRGLEAWSGPYTSSEGEYYYNEILKESTWDSPVAAWEQELATRHAVLCKCLLPLGIVLAADGSVVSGVAGAASAAAAGPDFLQALRLPLGLVRREGSDVPDTPSTRSFHTARSVVSARLEHRSSPRPPAIPNLPSSQEEDSGG